MPLRFRVFLMVRPSHPIAGWQTLHFALPFCGSYSGYFGPLPIQLSEASSKSSSTSRGSQIVFLFCVNVELSKWKSTTTQLNSRRRHSRIMHHIPWILHIFVIVTINHTSGHMDGQFANNTNNSHSAPQFIPLKFE